MTGIGELLVFGESAGALPIFADSDSVNLINALNSIFWGRAVVYPDTDWHGVDPLQGMGCDQSAVELTYEKNDLIFFAGFEQLE